MQILHLRSDACLQEFDGALKIVKVEADPCPNLVEKYKVSVNVSYLTYFILAQSPRLDVPVVFQSKYVPLADTLHLHSCCFSCESDERNRQGCKQACLILPGWLHKLRDGLQVYGLPTLVLFKDGAAVKGSQKEGALGKPIILKYLESYGVLPQTAQ